MSSFLLAAKESRMQFKAPVFVLFSMVLCYGHNLRSARIKRLCMSEENQSELKIY